MKTFTEMQQIQPVQPLTEAEFNVKLPQNWPDMTLAEISRWLKNNKS